ncbi:MAG: hypothetical protein KDA71_11890, partial [Planctomycetales bacterium]|nr:hypothetical protein [Planctomycetales bacterium]
MSLTLEAAALGNLACRRSSKRRGTIAAGGSRQRRFVRDHVGPLLAAVLCLACLDGVSFNRLA